MSVMYESVHVAITFHNNVDPDQMALMAVDLQCYQNRIYQCLAGQVLSHDLFVCFVALRPKSTAMVMAGRSVHLTTLFPGQALTSI